MYTNGDSSMPMLQELLLDQLSPEIMIHHILIHVEINFNSQMKLEHLISSNYSQTMNEEQQAFVRAGTWKIARDPIPAFVLTRLLFGYFRSDPSRTPHQIFSSFRTNWHCIQLNKERFSRLPRIRSIKFFQHDPALADQALLHQMIASRHLVSLELGNGVNLHQYPQIGSKKTQFINLESDSIMNVDGVLKKLGTSAKRLAKLCLQSRTDLTSDPATHEIDFEPLLRNGGNGGSGKANNDSTASLSLKSLIIGRCHRLVQYDKAELNSIRYMPNFDRFLSRATHLQILHLEIVPETNLIDLQYLPSSLLELNLLTNGCLDPYVRFIADSCPNLRKLVLNRGRLGSDPSFDSDYCADMARIFDSDVMPRLTHVDISFNESLNNVQIFRHLSRNRTLVRVDLNGSFCITCREHLLEMLGDNDRVTLANAPNKEEQGSTVSTVRTATRSDLRVPLTHGARGSPSDSDDE